MSLRPYRAKRDFARTPEPSGDEPPAGKKRDAAAEPCFVVQQHAARRMHYDLRLELDGVLKSWAVPRGPSLDPAERRLAVQTEDHPRAYASFEGVIPKGAYGGGRMIVWDEGSWQPEGDARRGLKKGHLSFTLRGHKLRGAWQLVRMGDADGTQWLLFKTADAHARPGDAIVAREPHSVRSGRTVEEVDGPPPAAAVRPERAGPTGAKAEMPTKIPDDLAPQLATLVASIPVEAGWAYELKLDGYRLLAVRDGAVTTLRTRSGHDWTDRLRPVAAAVDQVACRSAVLDGELVVLDAAGASSFAGLQQALATGETQALVYCVFDLLFLDGRDLRAQPLRARKALLLQLLAGAGCPAGLRAWPHVEGAEAARVALAGARARGLEGLVGKRLDAPYVGRRTPDWIKIKCTLRQEFVVGGFAAPQASEAREAAAARALLVGTFDASGALVYAGRVGTGLRPHAATLAPLLQRSLVRRSPFAVGTGAPDASEADVAFVRPEQVVEVRFAQWTPEGRLRHATLVGLRADKPAPEVRREAAASAPHPDAVGRPPSARPGPGATAASRTAATTRARAPARPKGAGARAGAPAAAAEADSAAAGSARVGGVALSSPGRLVAVGSAVTKLELARYLLRVAPRMLQHIAGRPLSVLRCTEPQAQPFFHKHLEPAAGLEPIAIDGRTYLHAQQAAGLVALVQRSALELHVWGCRAPDVEAVDTLVLDLDPGEDVEPEQVVAAAREMRAILADLALDSLVKATGGKGLHVVVPGVQGCSWADAKQVGQFVADYAVARAPRRYVATMSKKARRGKIFIDYFRNGRGNTAIACYSPRARPGLPVARPLSWAALDADAVREPWDVPAMMRAMQRGLRDPWRHAHSWSQPLEPGLLQAARGHAHSRP